MMATQDALDLLRSIDASLKVLVAAVRNRPQTKAVATDRELDSQYGDPLVKFMPRDWTGPSYKGRHMSQCPADLLDLLADTFEYFAMQAEQKGEMTERGKPVADYKRKDAARARGWANRVRSGAVTVHPVEPPTAPEWASEDSFS